MTAHADIRSDQTLEQGFQLGDLRIDPLAGEVSGPGGREKLDPKVMNVLVLLAQHAGQVVLREHLLAQLWPNAVVTDDALTRCLYELRRHLSQAGGDEQYREMLETVPKRGYRLNGEVTLLEPRPSTRPRVRSNRLLLASAIAIPAALLLWFTVGRHLAEPIVDSQPSSVEVSANSIAVLPFTDMSAGQDQGYLSDGITEEILNRLTQSGKLRVISRTSSFSFRDKPVDIREIAARLDVSHVLEGSVRRSGDSIRITAQLVAASDNSQVWSNAFNRKLGDLFEIQGEIAASVATALDVTLAGEAPHGRMPASVEAHERFLRGEFFYNRRAPGDIVLAAKYYEEALVIEPEYARPWAALAGAYSLLAFDGNIPQEVGLAKQGEAARKAVALDPNLAVGHARLGQYYFDIGDRKTSYEIFDRALALDPDDPHVLAIAGGIAMRNGDVEGAIERYRRIIARDPLSASYRANLGVYLLAADRLEDAKSELRKALEFNPNFGWGVELAIARILVLQGRFEEARSAITRLPEGEGRDHGLALLAHALGRRAEADAALGRLVAQSTSTPDIRLAEVYAFRGMTEEAFRALQGVKDAVDRNEPSSASQLWNWQVEMRVSPFLKPLHADPRWAALMIEPD